MMKFTPVILLITFLQVSASTFGQHITMNRKSVSLDSVFREIRTQTGYDILLISNRMKSSEVVTVNFNHTSLDRVMDELLKNRPVEYVLDRKTVVIRDKKNVMNEGQEVVLQTMDTRGQVFVENNTPLEGANVRIMGTPRSILTNDRGEFLFRNVNKTAIIQISYLGYQSQELPVQSNLGVIVLQPTNTELNEVVVNTGLFKRDKQTFTGAEATFSGEELRQVGSLNVIQSLRTLDPSFIITPNNILGSNPNQIPQIEVRGKTSLSTSDVRDQFTNDPNQPLFILNGMETTIQQIVDLDMNRVASVTLLKDAASTALYGSRAANGVLIVETIRPTAGQMRLSYTSSTRLEIPDLSDYNMMNAQENLEFQRLAGLYTNNTALSYYTDNLYNQRLKSVQSGINSYWLSVPLRNSVTQAHSLNISGGSEEFQYAIGLNYRKLNGVMKGSDRTTPGATIDFSYRTGKINISNQFYINGYVANESPYGTFANYVNLNPYYNKYDEDGNLNTNRYLETYLMPRFGGAVDTVRVTNPLYNATLNSVNRTSNTLIQDNLQAIWDVTSSWRFSAGLQVQKGITNVTLFLPASHTNFEQTDFYRKGLYTNTKRDDFSYQTNVMLTYRKVFNHVHSITGNVRGELQEVKYNSLGITAEGFPEGVNANPAFAYSYQQGGKPLYSTSKARRANMLASFNYAYDNRYYADLTYRLDGSTSFGSEKQFSPFWSAGLGWNINREKWLSNVDWLNQLRLRGTIGVTGNQSLGSYASSNVYTYENNLNPFGQGVYLSQLGNPNLDWQRTTSTNLGIDAALANNRLNITINAYRKVSSPLIATGNNPSSSGVSTYVLNVGELKTKGIEFSGRYSPIYNTRKQVLWTIGLTGSTYKSEYGGFSNILRSLNDAAQANNQLQRYLDGYSPDEQWAVTSMGIDPASGREVFQRKDGTLSFVYDVADIVPQGQSRPTVQGVFSSNLNYKGFLLSINIRYSLGAYLLNSALYSKVENITEAMLPNNQDRRALELRWQNPGDVAEFKAISITSSTPISSRFIQKENYISGESINVGYDFIASKHPWLKRIGLKTLRMGAMMNEIFRISTIKAERGIDYPFSRTVSFNANLFF